jgi:hypothetical protein
MTVLQPCAVKIVGEGLFGGQKLSVSDIETKLITRRPKTLEQYLGLFIDFPLTTFNEDAGFGQCHTSNFRKSHLLSSTLSKFDKSHYNLSKFDKLYYNLAKFNNVLYSLLNLDRFI